MNEIISLAQSPALPTLYGRLAETLAGIVEHPDAPLAVVDQVIKFTLDLECLDQTGDTPRQAEAAKIRASLSVTLNGIDPEAFTIEAAPRREPEAA